MDIRDMSTTSIMKYLENRGKDEYSNISLVVEHLKEAVLKKIHPISESIVDIECCHVGEGLWTIVIRHKPSGIKQEASGILVDRHYSYHYEDRDVGPYYESGRGAIEELTKRFSEEVFVRMKELTGIDLPELIKKEKAATKRQIEDKNCYPGKLYPDY